MKKTFLGFLRVLFVWPTSGERYVESEAEAQRLAEMAIYWSRYPPPKGLGQASNMEDSRSQEGGVRRCP